MSKRAVDGRKRARACVALTALAALGAGAVPMTAGAASPPDGRAYELVTPNEKNGGVPQFPIGASSPLGFIGLSALTASSADGEQVMWMSLLPLPFATNGLPMSYESHRTEDGWATEQTSPDPTDPVPNVLLSISVIGDATDDFSTRIFPSTQRYDPLNTAPFGRRDLYAQDADHDITWLTRPNTGSARTNESVVYQGRNPSATHIFFGARERLVPEANANLGGRILYDYSGGQVSMVNLRDDGTPTTLCGASIGWSANGAAGRVVRTAVSPDASSIYFTSPEPSGSGNAACNARRALFRRAGGRTVEVSASQRAVADPLGIQNAQFQGASETGDVAYFTSATALTDDAADGTAINNLLLYRWDAATRLLSLVAPNSSGAPLIRGVVDLSPDGSRIYLISGAQLLPGQGTPLGANLYTWKDGTFQFIGEVSAPDQLRLLGADSARAARVSEDGDRFTFVSEADLGGFSAGGMRQVYVYEASSDTLWCASCPETGTPSGDATLQRDAESRSFVTNSRPRAMIDNGQTVFFDTSTALVPEDDNGNYDVYKWTDRGVELISGGHGADASFFVDASADGRSVFFTTQDRLVPQDTNVDADIYVARVGGGFPAPPPPPGECVDDQCQGQPKTPPLLPTALSDLDFGIGNVIGDGDVEATFTMRSISRRARQRFARTGKLTLVLRASDAGTARARAKASVRGRSRVVARARQETSGGAVRLRLQLSSAARSKLESTGRLRVKITVTFSGAATSQTATLTLRQARG